MNEALQRLIDREEIRDVMARYARGVDRADWEGGRATYHDDAFDDHGDFKGSADGFIAFAKERTGDTPSSIHFLGNCLIEFAADGAAIVEAYFFTAHTLGPKGARMYEAGDESVQISMYGRYVDRMEKRAGHWRIARRFVVFEATRVHRGDSPPMKPDWAHHDRGPADPIWTLRAEAGLPAPY